jgi:hypothetical protein
MRGAGRRRLDVTLPARGVGLRGLSAKTNSRSGTLVLEKLIIAWNVYLSHLGISH